MAVDLDSKLSGLFNKAELGLWRARRLTDGFGWQPALSLLRREMIGADRLEQVQAKGAPPLWARLGRRETDLDTLLHVWRERCYELPTDAMPNDVEPRWIIDAGANVGYATRWLAETYPSATVIAIEPDRANVEILRRNVDGLRNVTVLEAALATEVGEIELFDVGEGPWSYRVGAAGEGAGRTVRQVPCVSIGSLMAQYGMDRIDYLKVDIEGAELELFSAAEDWIDKVDAVVVELHDRFRPGCTRAFLNATRAFETEFARGENFFALRGSTRVQPAATG
ncbi:MAG: FkbM family methyltransferase [Acidimicrobiales bacterium]